MSKAGAAKAARAREPSASKCTSSRMSLSCAKRAKERASTAKRWKSSTAAKASRMCWPCAIEEALGFFDSFNTIKQLLQAMNDVGLSYVELGQSSTTLSGGEAQRVKLATELGKPSTGHTLYVLDEPTTGLHFADIHNLLSVLNRLVDQGNTVLVIEHNLDVIKCADWIIDLGPEGGEGGGTVVDQGPPEKIVSNPKSFTGQYLKPKLAAPLPVAAAG